MSKFMNEKLIILFGAIIFIVLDFLLPGDLILLTLNLFKYYLLLFIFFGFIFLKRLKAYNARFKSGGGLAEVYGQLILAKNNGMGYKKYVLDLFLTILGYLLMGAMLVAAFTYAAKLKYGI